MAEQGDAAIAFRAGRVRTTTTLSSAASKARPLASGSLMPPGSGAVFRAWPGKSNVTAI